MDQPIYFKRFDANTQGRDFVIGDLHGQLDQLFRAMESVRFNTAKDRLFSVGDLIDRGEDSLRAFELLHESWFFAVRGNHEAMMFNAYLNRDPKEIGMWMNSGGRRWIDDFDQFCQTHHEFCRFVEDQALRMPWSIEVALPDGRRIGLVHAECPCKDWQQLESTLANSDMSGKVARYDALWSRTAKDPGAGATIENIDLTVHGHTIVSTPQRRHNSCYIDTGACLQSKRFFGLIKKQKGYLTLIQMEDLFELS
ncbi:MAG: metallophosphoesterase [Motiliproteus sp.]|nr:metallophosphoesterase [Motiliproteus sp.]MCW9051635.1 metallophosphoesterase [Motiliproteus sp.]